MQYLCMGRASGRVAAGVAVDVAHRRGSDGEDELSRQFDALLAKIDLTAPAFADSMRADAAAILKLNRLPVVRACRESAYRASGGRPFRTHETVFALPYHDESGVLTGSMAYTDLAVALIPERVARALSDSRSYTEIWDDSDGRLSRTATPLLAKHILVHEFVHLTQDSDEAEQRTTVDLFFYEGFTEWLTCHELLFADTNRDGYIAESGLVDELLAFTEQPLAVARACSAVGGAGVTAVFADALGIEVANLQGIFESNLPARPQTDSLEPPERARCSQQRLQALLRKLEERRQPDLSVRIFANA